MRFYSGSIEPALGLPELIGSSYPTLSHKKSAFDVKVGKRTNDFEPCLVLGNTPITNMAKAKYLFNDQERMLAFGPYLRLCAVL